MSVKRPDPVDIEVGHRIRIERLARGLSQTALATQLGVTFQQVQKYEKGVNRVGAGRLTKIAEVLGIEVSTFFGGKDILGAAKEGGEASPLKLLTLYGALMATSRTAICAARSSIWSSRSRVRSALQASRRIRRKFPPAPWPAVSPVRAAMLMSRVRGNRARAGEGNRCAAKTTCAPAARCWSISS
jgi:transcriptional regulator with XRE-family HTH domain